MDVMQLAGELSLRHGAVVTGPYQQGDGQQMVQILLKDGSGVGIVHCPDGAKWPCGEWNVWGIREESQEPRALTRWCVPYLDVLPAGVAYGVTPDRIRDVVAALAVLAG